MLYVIMFDKRSCLYHMYSRKKPKPLSSSLAARC